MASLDDECKRAQSKFQQEDKIVLQHASAVQKSSKSDRTDCEGSDELQKSDETNKKGDFDFAQNHCNRDSQDSFDSIVRSLKKPIKRLNNQDLEDRRNLGYPEDEGKDEQFSSHRKRCRHH